MKYSSDHSSTKTHEEAGVSQYIIRVEGLLSSGLIETLPHMTATQHAETVLQGDLSRQSELASVLDHLGALGVNILAVHRLPHPPDEAAS